MLSCSSCQENPDPRGPSACSACRTLNGDLRRVLDDMGRGDQVRIDNADHRFVIVALDMARSSRLIACSTCRELIAEETTSPPIAHMAHHIAHNPKGVDPKLRHARSQFPEGSVADAFELGQLRAEVVELRREKTIEKTIEPIPVRIPCPECGELHVDEGEFATKPHHTHACQACGMVWRPAIVATVGVHFLPGFKNT